MGIDSLPNIDELLAPISDEAPAGQSLRERPETDALYRQLKDARARARVAERRRSEGDPEYVDKMPDWDPLLEEAPGLLQNASKDLELAAWLTEAMVRRFGFAGLRDGLRLIRELVERYWDGLYPMPDEEGINTRVAPVIGLSGDEADGTLLMPMALVPIIESRSGDTYGEASYREAAELEKLDEEARQRRISAGATSFDKLQQAAAETPPAFFRELLEVLGQCQQECTALDAAIAKRFEETDPNAFPPTLSNLQRQIEKTFEAARAIGAQRAVDNAAPTEIAPAAGAIVEAKPGVAGVAGDVNRAVMTRDAAFDQLLQVADFFRRTEPQSIVSYALQQVVRWGRMPLPELLAEFVPDQSSRNHFGWLGIVPRAEQQQEESGEST